MNKHTAELLEQHFDTAFAAPDGIKKLRELILTLAMQGKLVPQDPSDQPASELLKEIEAEKQRLVKAGKIRKPKPLPPVSEEEKPYALPQGWEWVRLRNICHDWGQKVPDSHFTYIDVSAIDNKSGRISEAQSISASDAPSRARKIVRPGDVIYSTVRPYLLNVAIVDREYDPAPIASTAFAVLHPYNGISNSFVFRYLRSPIFISYVEQTQKGVAYPAINDGDFFSGLFPLAPLAEQHRIVTKIDELMARCDELEKLRATQQEQRLTVHAAAIKQLLNITEPDQHQRAQAFLAEHFGELYTVKENVAELRKAILQLAVMGKLVPNPEPVKSMTLGSILSEASINGVSKGPVDDTSKTEILRISAGTSRSDFYVDESDIKYVNLTENEIEKFKLQANDLLACRFNGNLHYVGRFSLYRGISGRTQVNPDKLIRFRINSTEFSPRYVCYAMNSKASRDVIESMCATTAGNIGLSAGRLKKVSIPVPSLEKQEKIVRKIEDLMGLCDSLDQNIETSNSKRNEILNALIHAQSHAKAKPPIVRPSATITNLADYRAAIGCYTLDKLANAKYFGRTAAAKVLYLAQAYVGLELNLQPEREAAGPYDPWIREFENQGQDNGWFEVNDRELVSGKIKKEYRCLPDLSVWVSKAIDLMQPGQKAEFDRLIHALADKTTEEVEIIATLFAVWNDFLIDGTQPTDEQITTDLRENWHQRKARFTPAKLGQWLGWLRTENFVPRGLLPRTVQQSSLVF